MMEDTTKNNLVTTDVTTYLFDYKACYNRNNLFIYNEFLFFMYIYVYNIFSYKMSCLSVVQVVTELIHRYLGCNGGCAEVVTVVRRLFQKL